MARVFGEPNLLKRLQVGAIMDALAIRPGERALDFGCGSGYMTVELARAGAVAIGIDVNPFVADIAVPGDLSGRLSFRQASGAALPFDTASFDVVLASEVLPMLPQPGPFLDEIRRVLKPGGRLVVPNGTGPRTIARAYAERSPRLAKLAERHPERMPESYRDYVQVFQRIAGTAREDFMSEDDVIGALKSHGFDIARRFYAPSRRAGDWLAWHQFEHYLKTGKVVPTLPFVPAFLFLGALSLGDREGYEGGLVVVAHAPTKN